MNLRHQISGDRVEGLASMLGISSEDALVRYACSPVNGRSTHAHYPPDVVEGGQDKQMDVLVIDGQSDSGDVFMLQTRCTDSFSSNVPVQQGNGLT